MEKIFNRTMTIVLALCLLTFPLFSASAVTASAEKIMPVYNNTNNASADMSISNSGKMVIHYKYSGTSGVTTKAVITTYIEKENLRLILETS